MEYIQLLFLVYGCVQLAYGQLTDRCAGIQCSPPNCVDTYIPLGGCCPTCAGPGRRCTYRANNYFDEQSFMEDCNTCSCRGGEVVCTQIFCPNDKAGSCPRPTGVGICVENCMVDADCPRKKKCCSNGCGHSCMRPQKGKPCRHKGEKYKHGAVFQDKCNTCTCTNGAASCTKMACPNKPGSCPAPLGVGICVDECTDDYNCPGDDKCCSNGCGRSCMMPGTGGGTPCLHNGISYPDGNNFMDDCNTCTCRNGVAGCTRMACPSKPCIYNGISYADGDTFMDDCNTCTCRGGKTGCTRMACPSKPCIYNGISYADGDTFMDDCNTCTCRGGKAGCTRMACPSKPCIYNGISYPDGDTFMDDCNTCTCRGGKAGCTRMACPKTPCFHNGISYNDGATFKDDCNTCICSDGIVECTLMACPNVKPGDCPPPIGVGVCVDRCTTDLSCPGREKCCSTGCGTLCLPPRNGGLPCTYNGLGYNDGDTFMDGCNTCICNNGQAACTKIACPDSKPGTCPVASGPGICVEDCTTDRNCPRKEKCCSNGCGSVCMRPEIGGKSCIHNGMNYKDGESFKDACNACTCNNGRVACTEMACVGIPCVYKGQTYNHGQGFKDACNTCNCNDGIATCTRMLCPEEKPGTCPAYSEVGGICVNRCTTDASCPGAEKCCNNGCGTDCKLPSTGGRPCVHNGVTYRDGEAFKDKCNTCSCSDGKAICTLMACPGTPCQYKGKTYSHGETFKDKCNTCNCNDGMATCTLMGCPDEKLGHCPVPSGVGICVDRCTTDLSCPGREKCCSNGCGKDCTLPTIGKPCYNKGIEYADGQSFMDDCNTCRCNDGNAACTRMGCGGTCTYKGRSYKEGDSFKDDCNTCNCNRGKVSCTKMECSGTKPGTCPLVSNRPAICVDDCTRDLTCPGVQKCCSNGCGHVCMNPDYGGRPCFHQGNNFTDGETFKDDCNTCRCTDGNVACTLKACPPKQTCYFKGVIYKDGDKFQNDCNTCACSNGRILCTIKACGKQCDYKGVTYQDGQNFRDECNTCACRDGKVACTIKQCADEKPGSCPRPSMFSVCLNRCTTDSSCSGKKKCCTNWCGKMCMDPVGGVDICAGVTCPAIECPRGHEQYTPRGRCCPVCRPPAGEKPGRCPHRPRRGACVDMCSSDFSCPGQQKCCSNRCGHSCMRPTRFDRCYGVSCPPLRCLRQFRPPGRCCPVCRRGGKDRQ